jgi:glycosyltransferase 2 family protein
VRRRAWLAAQIVIGLVIVAFLCRYVARNWTEIRHAGAALDIHPWPLAAAAGIILLTYAMLIGAWTAVLRGWGERLPYRRAARIWCLSNLARYVPGRVWQIAGMAALAQQAGVSPWAAAGSAIVVQCLAIATGTLVTVSFAPQFGHPLLIAGAGVVTAAGAAALAWPTGAAGLSRLIRRVTGRAIELRPVRPGPLLLSAGITVVAWVLYGLALYLSVRGLTGRSIGVGGAVGVFTGSYVAGLVNIFTSAGLGTREWILVNWLNAPIGPAAATVVTIGSRLLMSATEVLAAAVSVPFGARRPDGR